MKKRLKWILVIFLACLAAASAAFFLFADAATLEAAKERFFAAWAWVEANVLSDMLATGALVGLVSLELIPVMNSFVQSRNAFSKVASDVEDYTAARIEYDRRSEEREHAFYTRMEEIRLESEAQAQAREEELQSAIRAVRALAEGYGQQLSAVEERLSAVLRHVENCADKTERMVYLGFTNSSELVKNTAARRIAEVEEHEE